MTETQNPASTFSLPPSRLVILGLLGVGLFWANWPFIAAMAWRWRSDAQYSHGWFVPLFACLLLYLRLDQLPRQRLRMNLWGLAVMLFGELCILTTAFLYLDGPAGFCLIIVLTGLTLLMGGLDALRWAWPSLAFLCFMLPLPYSLETALAFPLRKAATEASTYFAQTLGFAAMAEGTDIHLGEQVIQVAPACSGMGMLLVFFALSTAIVLVVDRPPLDKCVIFFSAIPIAVVANIMRITITAFLFQIDADDWTKRQFHNFAGYFMMMIALALLFLELKIIDHMFFAAMPRKPMQLMLPTGAVARDAKLLQQVKASADGD